ncbi:MAG TPA: hypothetical protein VGG64_28760 [Pirellulales bacterium]|jgi:hypothetical protein
MKLCTTILALLLVAALATLLGFRSAVGWALMACVVIFWVAAVGVLSELE